MALSCVDMVLVLVLVLVMLVGWFVKRGLDDGFGNGLSDDVLVSLSGEKR